jgi:glycosyltransferase involved in cell wall biosynthesis
MRIGFISEHYPPTDGGVATSTRRLARTLAKRGTEVHVFCFDSSRPLTSADYAIQENDEGVQVTRVGPFFTKQPSRFESISEKTRATLRRRAFDQMSRLMRPWCPDLVLSFYLLNAGYVANFVARTIGVPHVASIRGNDIGRNIFNVERFSVIQWIASSVQRLVCVNEHLRKRLLLAFPDAAERVGVIRNAVEPIRACSAPLECRERVRLATGWNDTDLRLVFIGTFREKKGIAAMLRVMRALGPRGTVSLLVVGPDLGSTEVKMCGDIWSELHSWGRVHATGWLDRDDVYNWAAGGDVIVMPSLDDGMANGLLEGMSIGLCPLVSDIFSDVVTNETNGLIFPAGDEKALSDAVSRLAADRALVSQLGKRASDLMTEFAPELEAEAYLQIFSEWNRRN